MVMGHPDCPSFCKSCKQSCKCPSCGKCHWCNQYPDFYGNYNHHCGHSNAKHSCEAYMRELKRAEENIESQKIKLEAEISRIKSKNHELELELLRRNTERIIVREFPRFFGSETFPIIVGSERQKFSIHVDTVCVASAHLREILCPLVGNTGNSKEYIVLDGGVYNVDAFQMFLQYCYLGTYTSSNSKWGEILLHARVYTLANELRCSPLKGLALQRVMDWYRGYDTRAGRNMFQDIFPEILDAINVIYTYTVDIGSGLLPSSFNEVNSGEDQVPARDKFRLFLAHLAAEYLIDLRAETQFVDIHHKFPDFNTDMLLFIGNETKIPTEETSPGVPPDGERNTIHLQKKSVLAFSDLLGGDTFTVFVGEDAKRFNVHTAAIECSEYFRRLVASDMKEAHEKSVHLDSEVDNVDAFDAFVQYCYLQDYASDDDRADTLAHHARVYALAERLSCLSLKELALRKALELCLAPYPSELSELLIAVPAAVATIYEHSYDAWSGKIPKAPIELESLEDAQGGPSGVKDVVFGARGITHPTETKTIPDTKERDGFRLLLARFASANLSELRKNDSFITTHHAFPDFATDVLFRVSNGKKMEFDQNGKLTLA